MWPPSTSTAGWSPSMSCHPRCGSGWPVSAAILTVKVDYTQRPGAVERRRRTPRGPSTSATYEELVISCAQLSAGIIPERPFLLVGR